MQNLKQLNNDVSALALGQVGYLFTGHGVTIAIDPYLTDAVAVNNGPDFARQVPAPLGADEVPAVDLLLISHAHDDHTDPATIEMFLVKNPQLPIIAPQPSAEIIRTTFKLSHEQLHTSFDSWYKASDSVNVLQVPAAHPNLVALPDGTWAESGFLIRFGDTVLYHAGDTSVEQFVINTVRNAVDHIDYAFLPVNENNFFRTRAGIIGNLTVREAFQFTQELGAKTLVPTHWDLFKYNGLVPEELDLLYRRLKPKLDVLWLSVEAATEPAVHS